MFRTQDGLDALLARPRPSTWQLFIRGPAVYIARALYSWRPIIPIRPISPISVVCVSDTHNGQPAVPFGEILIHAGDLTQSGTLQELQTSLDWINSLPHAHKIVVAGNHDLLLDQKHRPADTAARQAISWGGITYLENQKTTITSVSGRRIKVYGSPLSPRHGNWAFQYPRTQDVWNDVVPTDIDILITHGPPKAHLDLKALGCKFLLDEIWRKKPRLHVFGHVHEGYGQEWIQFDSLQKSYEDTLIAGGGIWNVGRVLFEFVLAYFRPLKESRALLVNAAAVGGLHDDQKRLPIIVEL